MKSGQREAILLKLELGKTYSVLCDITQAAHVFDDSLVDPHSSLKAEFIYYPFYNGLIIRLK